MLHALHHKLAASMAAQCWRFLEIAEQLKKAKVAVGETLFTVDAGVCSIWCFAGEDVELES